MTDRLVELDVAAGVATLRLNRPAALNALNAEMARAIHAAVSRVAEDDAARVLVVRGAGRAFSAGGDVKEMTAASQSPTPDAFFTGPLAYLGRMVTALFELEKPTIAVVHGFATGGGMSLALACDLRIAATSARLNQAFVNLGLVPDMGSTWTLPRLVGYAKAAELAFLGDFVDGTEAERLGIVNRAVPEERLDAEVAAWAARLAAGPTRAIARTKALLRSTWTRSFAEQAEAERRAQEELGRGTADYREGMRALSEKRPPRFQGR
jgi:2-(1,2-epoxy-1,2-dihydrophenyl)acetyl-CoA isomerase